MKLFLPPLNEQRRIVEKIETLFARLNKGEAALREVRKLLARYRQSVLKAAVTGQLTADWRTENAHRLEHGRDLLERILQARRENWQGQDAKTAMIHTNPIDRGPWAPRGVRRTDFVAGCAGPRIKPVGQEKSKQMHRDNHAISIDRVHIHEIDALLSLYVDLFHDREPLTKCIGFGKERMISIVRTMHADSNDNVLSRGLCWIARDRAEANRDVGFIVCDDPAIAGAQRMPDNLTDDEAEKVSVVASLLEEVRDPVKDRLALEPGTCLHVSALGVAPEYEGAGIAKRFLQTALSGARARGFLYAFAECTSPASRMLHENFGFNSLRSVPVSDFVADRKFSFANCDIDIHLMWMIFDEGKSR